MFLVNVFKPNAILSLPTVFVFKASAPNAMFPPPVVVENKV